MNDRLIQVDDERELLSREQSRNRLRLESVRFLRSPSHQLEVQVEGEIVHTSRETVRPPTSCTMLISAREVSENPV